MLSSRIRASAASNTTIPESARRGLIELRPLSFSIKLTENILQRSEAGSLKALKMSTNFFAGGESACSQKSLALTVDELEVEEPSFSLYCFREALLFFAFAAAFFSCSGLKVLKPTALRH